MGQSPQQYICIYCKKIWKLMYLRKSKNPSYKIARNQSPKNLISGARGARRADCLHKLQIETGNMKPLC